MARRVSPDPRRRDRRDGGLLSVAAAPATVPRPTKFDYTLFTLPNGLQTVLLEDHSTPIVHLAVWYHVGSKDERPGRTGFAHLFEHLMFKGSKNVGPGSASVAHHLGRRPVECVHRRGHDGVLGDGAGAVSAARALARGGPHGVARRERREVQDRARGRQGRAPDAVREPALRPALRKSSTTRRSRRTPTNTRRSAAWPTSTPRQSRTCARSTTRITCRTTRRSRSSATSTTAQAGRAVTQYLGPVPRGEAACRATFRSSRRTRPRRGFTVTRDLAAAGRRRVLPHHLMTDILIRIRCTFSTRS